MIIKVYVIGPLETFGNIEENKSDALRVGQKIVQLGGIAIVPHMFNLEVGHYQERKWWLKVDLALLSTCHAAVTRHYYEESSGSMIEFGYCRRFGIPMYKDTPRDWASLEMYIQEWSKREDPQEELFDRILLTSSK